jgi:hypothetical protein
MNPLLLEPAAPSDVAALPGRRALPVAPVRAIRPQSGLLACIESIARDCGRPASQQALLQHFPRRCRRFQADEGRIGYRDALELMADLGLAESFETVRDLAGIADLADRVDRGVILAVPSAAGGEPRWWRLAAVRGDGIAVMQPEAEDPTHLMALSWPEVEHAGIWALALD